MPLPIHWKLYLSHAVAVVFFWKWFAGFASTAGTDVSHTYPARS